MDIPGLVDLRSSAEMGNPEVQVRFDREQLARLGLDLATVAQTVRTKVQGEVATRFTEGDREIDIRVRALDQATARVAVEAVDTPGVVADGLGQVTGRASARIGDAVLFYRSENVFNNGDVAKLAPQAQQPFLMTIDCLNGYFHYPYLDSLGEALVKAGVQRVTISLDTLRPMVW